MMSTATALTSACARRGCGPKQRPREKSDYRDRNHDGDKPFCYAIGESLDGSAAALRLADELHDARQQRLAAHALGAHDERAGAVDGCSDHFAVRRLFDRHGFAGDHGLVDGAAAFEENAIHGDFFSRAHAQTVSGLDLLERDILLTAVRRRAGGRSGD